MLVIRQACEDLVLAYCDLVDSGMASLLPDLFTDDAVFEVPPQAPWDRAEIERRFNKREGMSQRVSRHVLTNVRIEVVSEDEASGHCYYTLYRHDGDGSGQPVPLSAPAAVGDYRDRFRRTPNGWRIAYRVGTAAFVNAPAG